MVRWKCFVPQLYQFRRSISGGPAVKYFYMIHRGGRLQSLYMVNGLATLARQISRDFFCDCRLSGENVAATLLYSYCAYGVATMSRRLKITGLFCRISSLL